MQAPLRLVQFTNTLQGTDRRSIIADVWVGARRRATWPNTALPPHLSALFLGLDAMYFWVPRHASSIKLDCRIQKEDACKDLFQSYQKDDIKVDCVDSHVLVGLEALSLIFDSTAMQRRHLCSCMYTKHRAW